jgi:hypothetical protein
MTQLVELELRNRTITPAGLKPLAALPSLHRLFLWDVRMNDEAYRELEACRSLEVLELRGVDGPAAALGSLARCPRLKRLDAFRCRGVFDPKALEPTRWALPGVEVRLRD